MGQRDEPFPPGLLLHIKYAYSGHGKQTVLPPRFTANKEFVFIGNEFCGNAQLYNVNKGLFYGKSKRKKNSHGNRRFNG